MSLRSARRLARLGSFLRFAAACALGAGILGTTAFAQTAAPPSILQPVSRDADPPAPGERAVTRVRGVVPAFAILHKAADALARDPATPFPVLVDLFDDATLLVRFERSETLRDGTRTLVGVIADEANSSATLVFGKGIVSANFLSRGRAFQVRFRAGGMHEAREIDQRQFPESRGDTLEPPPAEKDSPPAAMSDDGSVIDVMVVYTADARAAVGGTAAMESLVALGITETNAAYANSNVNQRLRLVYSGEVSYTESGNPQTDLNRLSGTSDGFMDQVHALRNTYGADVVSLWVENGGGGCGIGYLMSTVSSSFASAAFNVVDRSCATGNYTFGHELGHNMGLRHDVYVDTASTPYPYAHGYVDPARRFRTVMAYNDQCVAMGFNCTRIQYFSNPAVTYGGYVTGNATADSRTALNNTAFTVANFRSAVAGTIPAAPTTITPSGTISSATPTYTWNSSAGAASYTLLVQNTAGVTINATYSASAAGCAGGGTCAVTPTTTLVNGASYNWFVNASNTAGTSGWSPLRSFTVNIVTSPPATPTTLSPTGTITTTTPAYAWNAVSGAASYNLLVQNTSGVAVNLTLSASAAGCGAGTGTCMASPSTALSNGSSYNWFVSATNAAGSSAWSAARSITINMGAGEAFPPNCAFPAGWVNQPAGAAAGWAVVSNTASEGSCSLKSAAMGDATSGVIRAQVQVTATFIAGNIMFDRRVSSESGWDCFRFLIDGVEQSVGGTCSFIGGTGASGEVPWGTVSVPISGGTHTLTWSYEKDSSLVGGSDAAWIDRVSLPLASTPSAPTTVSPSGTVTTLTPTFTWNAVAAAASYTLLVQNTAGVAVNLSVTAASAGCGAGTGTCSVTPSTALANGSTYNWFVRAVNSSGMSPWSAARTITVNSTVGLPGAPTTIAPSGTINTSTPTYSWNSSANAASYTLLVQNTAGVAVNQVVTAAAAGCAAGGTCSYTPSVALANATYNWFVNASNASGTSAWSAARTITVSVSTPTPPPTPSPIPISPSGTVGTATPTYTWSPWSGATSYYLLVQNTAGVAVSLSLTPAAAGCGSTCSYTPPTALANGATYSWFVNATTASGTTPWSSGLTITINATGPGVPAAPTLLSPNGNIGTTMPTYTWNASSGATTYTLLVQNTAGVAVNQSLSASAIGCGSGGTCSFTPGMPLAGATTYSWFVKAANSVGTSAWSAGTSFRTP